MGVGSGLGLGIGLGLGLGREAVGGDGLPESLVGGADGGATAQPEAESVGSALKVSRCARVRPA